MEVFELEAVELLDLQRIRIGHESSGGGNGWFLEKVVIKEAPDAEKQFVFECNRSVARSAFQSDHFKMVSPWMSSALSRPRTSVLRQCLSVPLVDQVVG